MHTLTALLRVLLWLLAALLAALALGAFAGLNPSAPIWMRTLSAFEGVMFGQWASSYVRGVTEALLSALAVFLAALPAVPSPPASIKHKPSNSTPNRKV